MSTRSRCRYARLTTLLAIALVYGSINPLLYLLVLIMTIVNYYSVRFAIAHWFAKPSNVTYSLSDRMRGILALILFLHVFGVFISSYAITGSVNPNTQVRPRPRTATAPHVACS